MLNFSLLYIIVNDRHPTESNKHHYKPTKGRTENPLNPAGLPDWGCEWASQEFLDVGLMVSRDSMLNAPVLNGLLELIRVSRWVTTIFVGCWTRPSNQPLPRGLVKRRDGWSDWCNLGNRVLLAFPSSVSVTILLVLFLSFTTVDPIRYPA